MKYAVILLLIGSLLLVGCINEPVLGGLAQCLTDKGVKMYGANWCPHCTNQKEAFGDDFQYIDYTECTEDQNACAAAGIQGLPTWVIDGKLYPGEQELDTLAGLAGC